MVCANGRTHLIQATARNDRGRLTALGTLTIDFAASERCEVLIDGRRDRAEKRVIAANLVQSPSGYDEFKTGYDVPEAGTVVRKGPAASVRQGALSVVTIYARADKAVAETSATARTERGDSTAEPVGGARSDAGNVLRVGGVD